MLESLKQGKLAYRIPDSYMGEDGLLGEIQVMPGGSMSSILAIPRERVPNKAQ
jgi:hypothetical protein